MALPSKTTTCFLQILVFAVPLSMASQINATVGQSVLLPCFIPPPPPHLGVTRVYWQTVEDSRDSEDNTLVVHFINMGVEELQDQALQYQNRTAMDLSQVAAGNLSLELRYVTEADNQTTICCLHSITKLSPNEVSRITLMVLPKPDAAPDPQSFPGWATGLLIGALLLVLACGVIFYKVHQRRTGQRDSTDAGANQDEEAGELQNLTANCTANSMTNGTAKGTVNGTANDTANGTANDTANGKQDKELQSNSPLRNSHS
ncbi:uncharacterized protein LOC121694272 isoform X3 [Alosa sapidissima]|uniref:uncharacterized protein LOC121694272 isoform X3 n=1 Tax=Alosa sapidissima TaxID=34773 RepID=UPI001C081455|nr:uncharacterized protein LOC121694272 isoform X3 [Alosa sapidissima]